MSHCLKPTPLSAFHYHPWTLQVYQWSTVVVSSHFNSPLKTFDMVDHFFLETLSSLGFWNSTFSCFSISLPPLLLSIFGCFPSISDMSANFPLSAALATDQTFQYVVFSFLFKWGLFWFTLIGSLWDSSRTSLAIGALEWIGSMWSHFKGVFASSTMNCFKCHRILIRYISQPSFKAGALETCRFWKKPSRLLWLPPPPWELLVYHLSIFFLFVFLSESLKFSILWPLACPYASLS